MRVYEKKREIKLWSPSFFNTHQKPLAAWDMFFFKYLVLIFFRLPDMIKTTYIAVSADNKCTVFCFKEFLKI